MKRMAMAFAFIALGLPQAGVCGGGMFAPTMIDSANVIPKGVRRVSFGGFSSELTNSYNGTGGVQPLGNGFNKQVTWRELVDSQPAGFERGQFKGGLESLGVNLDDVAGDARGMVNTRLTVSVPVLAMGITDKITVGVAIPILYTNYSVATGWTPTEAFQAKLVEAQSRGFDNKVRGYENQLRNVIETRIAGYGYEPLASTSATEVGDVILAMKYQLFKDSDSAFAIAPRLIAATGRPLNINRVIDIPSGDGQWDVGLGAIYERYLGSRFTLVSSLSYIHQLPATMARRIPRSDGESISPDVEQGLTAKYGDQMAASVGGNLRFNQLWSLGSAFSLQYKPRDTYTGGRFEAVRYEWLTQNSEQMIQTGVVGLSFSTVPLFRAKKFMLPLDATISFASILAGRNAAQANLTAFELAGYF